MGSQLLRGRQAIAKGGDRLSAWFRAGLLTIAIVALFVRQVYPLEPNRSLTQYVHRVWQAPQGLPEGTIFSIRQSGAGYLWLATQSGLVRFDGVQFSPVREAADVLPANAWVEDVLEDKNHNLWVACNPAGLIRLGSLKPKRFTEADGMPSDRVHCLFNDWHGNLWVGAAGGVARIEDGRLSAYSKEQGLSIPEVRAICQAKDGAIWVGGEGNQIGVWNGRRFVMRNLIALPADATIHALLPTNDGSVWVGASSGLVQVRGGRERRWTAADGLADDCVFSLAQARDKSLWIGTKQGFCRFQNGELDSFRPRDGLSQSTVYSLCEDHEGSLWAGTKHGLNQLSDRSAIPFTVSEGLPSNSAGPVLPDRDGKAWVGTLGAGLSQFDGRKFSVLSTEHGLASNTITALADGNEGELWVGGDKGLMRLRDGKVELTLSVADGLPSNEVRCLHRDGQSTLWVGTAAGIARYAEGRFDQPAGDDIPRTAAILAMTEHQGRLLMATAGGGLFVHAEDGMLRRFVPAAGASSEVHAFYHDTDGRLWMGTRGRGLALVDGDRLVHFSIQEGLYDDEIYSIAADNQDLLWLSCSKGVFSLKAADLRRLAAGQIKTLTSTPFAAADSLRTIECRPGVQPAAAKMADGRIWFSTTRGIVAIAPGRSDLKIPLAPVVIEELTVNGESQAPRSLEVLPPGQTNLSFRYTALSFRAPTRITFRYKLEGFDKDWVEADSRREAFYTNLAPGTYRFRVVASNVDGTSNEAVSPVTVTLQPYVYQRRWFIPACTALVLAAGGLVYHQRVRGIKRHVQAILTERNRIARELHDTLMQGFSGVTMEMQALIERLPRSQERAALEEILYDAGLCLREARRSVAALRSSGEKDAGLASAISQIAHHLTESKDVRLKLALGQNAIRLPSDVEFNLLRIAQEAISNSVKHSRARTIEVGLSFWRDRVRLSVKDDGVGFVVESGDAGLVGHYGLMGIRERAVQIGAQFRLESEPGRGTSLYVDVPVVQPAAQLPVGGRIAAD